METKFNFNSQVCTDKVQSERLLALGLKKETADCVWIEMSKDDWRIDANGWKAYYSIVQEGIFPAWNLHRLIEMMPTTINNMLWFNATHYTALYDSLDYIKSFDSKDNLYDNIIDCIEWLIKEGYFNKEYFV